MSRVDAGRGRAGCTIESMRVAVVVVAALLLGSTNPRRVEVTAENVHSLYKSFDRLTAEPMSVSPELSAQCMSILQKRRAPEAEPSNPHANALVHVYSHAVDPSVFASPERRFPVGTIVVKEKLASDLTAEGVGGMQKMEPGYDPEGGDWLYFYGSRSAGFTSGRLENCRSCHLGARASDFVYFVSGHEPADQAR